MKYYPKIDGLRFVAIALVLLEHFGNKIGGFISAGYYGVNLFFVVSGLQSILLNISTIKKGLYTVKILSENKELISKVLKL